MISLRSVFLSTPDITNHPPQIDRLQKLTYPVPLTNCDPMNARQPPFTCPGCGYKGREFRQVCPDCGRPFVRDFIDTQVHPPGPKSCRNLFGKIPGTGFSGVQAAGTRPLSARLIWNYLRIFVLTWQIYQHYKKQGTYC
jgi:hypothetical protein